MSVPTDQAILDSLKTALKEIADNGASSYSVNGRTWAGHNLKDLQQLIVFYETKIARSSRRMLAPISFPPMR